MSITEDDAKIVAALDHLDVDISEGYFERLQAQIDAEAVQEEPKPRKEMSVVAPVVLVLACAALLVARQEGWIS